MGRPLIRPLKYPDSEEEKERFKEYKKKEFPLRHIEETEGLKKELKTIKIWRGPLQTQVFAYFFVAAESSIAVFTFSCKMPVLIIVEEAGMIFTRLYTCRILCFATSI